MTPLITYSIKDLERLSGIKAHTIRIWEKRYGIPTPGRSDSNIRHYNDHDLKLLLNVSILRKKGLKISDIAALKEEEVSRLVMNGSALQGGNDPTEQMILAMLNLDEELFKTSLSRAILEHGIEGAFQKVIYPFFNRIGLMWQVGTIDPAQEHFVSNIIRQKLIVAINSQDHHADVPRKTVLIFLPEGEMHELGILFYTYIIRRMGFRVIYLGQSTPMECVENVYGSQHPDLILTSIVTARSVAWVNDYLGRLEKSMPAERILLSGPQVWQEGLTFPTSKRLKRFADAEALKTLLKQMVEEQV